MGSTNVEPSQLQASQRLGAIGFVVAIMAALIALVQLAETTRAISMDSLASVKEGYSGPKIQFYVWTLANANRLDPDDADYDPVAEIAAQIAALEYLRSIEFVLEAYRQQLLGDEAEEFVIRYVKADIENLLLCFYRDQYGSIGVTPGTEVPWITPGDDGSDDSGLGGYPATFQFVESIGLELKTKDCWV